MKKLLAVLNQMKKRYFAFETNIHPHFICNYCNTIECIDNFENIVLKNHTIENVILKGKCQKCSLV